MVEASVLADEAGFRGVHIGEHHGLEYVYPAPRVILSAIGERTSRLTLSTAVTLAANLDPVRVAEDYATVDVLSGGRCEVVVGRGTAFARTYDLFGQDITQSARLFDGLVVHPEEQLPAEPEGRAAKLGEVGVNHFGMWVADVDTVIERARKYGFEPVAPPRVLQTSDSMGEEPGRYSRGIAFYDPSGNVVQIDQRVPGPA